MFDDEKIKLIDAIPERDAILVIWVRLIILAGRINAGGVIYLDEAIPYTDEMLSTLFSRPVAIIRLALETFSRLKMIEILENGVIELVNWEKHQNIGALEKIREQNRLSSAKYREGKKIETRDITVISRQTLEENKNKNKTREEGGSADKSASCPFVKEIIEKLNIECNTHFKLTASHRAHINARWKEGFSKEDFFTVIARKKAQWFESDKMCIYLRPGTLFGTKMDAYLNE